MAHISNIFNTCDIPPCSHMNIWDLSPSRTSRPRLWQWLSTARITGIHAMVW